MTNILIWGVGGRLGGTVLKCLDSNLLAKAVGGVDKFADPINYSIPIYNTACEINVKADVIIDFSRADAVYDILPYAVENNLAVVLCTTGYTDLHLEYINSFKDKLALFRASNMSLGINLLIDLARKATQILGTNYDIELIEQHHNIKVDSPSGTAITIANAINEEMNNTKEFVYGRHSMNAKRQPQELGIHSIRGGTVVGKHEVLFLGNDEVITISHEASSKAVFAEGAIKAGVYIADKKPGMYDMIDLIANK